MPEQARRQQHAGPEPGNPKPRIEALNPEALNP